MSEPVPSAADPDILTPADRTRAVAALLAVSLLRLPRPGPTAPPAGEKVSENSRNGLATGPEQSVTVDAG